MTYVGACVSLDAATSLLLTVMRVPTLLSVGYDKYLLHTRAMILRHAGFMIDEAFTTRAALAMVKADSIDGILICHTVPRKEQRKLISAVRDVRKLLPIICVSDLQSFCAEPGCLATSNSPAELIDVVKRAILPD